MAERVGRRANPRPKLDKWQRKGRLIHITMLLTDRVGRQQRKELIRKLGI